MREIVERIIGSPAFGLVPATVIILAIAYGQHVGLKRKSLSNYYRRLGQARVNLWWTAGLVGALLSIAALINAIFGHS